jgi:hypothetical protein
MVKWPQQSEDLVMQFEGRTSDEAVRLARMEFGNDAPVRCWKARRGGLFGFFAKEVFVAGVEAPSGTARADTAVRAAAARSTIAAWSYDPANFADSEDDATWAPANEGGSLADLVEATRDELTLGSANVLETAFIDVLAQAQAALNLEQPTKVRQPEQPYLGATPPIARPAVFAAVPVPTREPPPGPERIAGLRAFVADFGVPSDYWPDESDATLDGLVRSFAKLPVARPLPTNAGSVVVVVGTRRDAHAAALRLVELMELETTDLIEAECTSASRQRVTRRRAGHATVVTIEAPLRSRELAQVATWIETLKPDYVVGTVSATAKRADVESWRHQLAHFDALALSRVGETTSPGELLGDLPILLVDGLVASALQWVALILGSLLEQQ